MAANVFDLVAKFCTVATNFLKFFSIGSDGVAFMVGALGVNCAGGRVYTGSREDATGTVLFLGWAMAPGYRFMGIG